MQIQSSEETIREVMEETKFVTKHRSITKLVDCL
jgi:hypothetical protein